MFGKNPTLNCKFWIEERGRFHVLWKLILWPFFSPSAIIILISFFTPSQFAKPRTASSIGFPACRLRLTFRHHLGTLLSNSSSCALLFCRRSIWTRIDSSFVCAEHYLACLRCCESCSGRCDPNCPWRVGWLCLLLRGARTNGGRFSRGSWCPMLCVRVGGLPCFLVPSQALKGSHQLSFG